MQLYINYDNPQVTKSQVIDRASLKRLALSMKVGTSEAIRVIQIYIIINQPLFKYIYIIFNNYYIYTKYQSRQLVSGSVPSKLLINPSNRNKSYIEWLAGFIDGKGYFSYSKKGYVALEIIISPNYIDTLKSIKQIYGGSIKPQSKGGNIRYKLHHKKGLFNQLKDLNGKLRNPIRIQQLSRLLVKYSLGTSLVAPNQVYNNGWLSGMIDSLGNIYINSYSYELCITISNNNRQLQDPLISLYGGQINITNTEGFQWIIYRKEELLALKEYYFSKYPLKSNKYNKIILIDKYFELRTFNAHQAEPDSPLGIEWKLLYNNLLM